MTTSKLTDEKIAQIAHVIDQFIIDMGEQYEPSGIELVSIMLGRMMVFSNQVGFLDTFHELLDTVNKLKQSPAVVDTIQ